MKMIAENAETVRIDGYTTFVVGFDDKTVELFAIAFNAAFATKTPADIYSMIAFIGNATEDTNVAVEEGYLTEADRISEIISLISEFGKFDDDSNEHETNEDADVVESVECMKMFEKTLDTTASSAVMGTESKQAFQSKETTVNVKKTLTSVVVWYDANTGKVSLAKCRKTGKFVSLAIAQGMLNIELKTFRMPSTDMLKVSYSFLCMLMFVVATILALGVAVLVIGLAVHSSAIVTALFTLLIPAFAGLAAISAEESVEVRV